VGRARLKDIVSIVYDFEVRVKGRDARNEVRFLIKQINADSPSLALNLLIRQLMTQMGHSDLSLLLPNRSKRIQL
jgi:hypothetical protein